MVIIFTASSVFCILAVINPIASASLIGVGCPDSQPLSSAPSPQLHNVGGMYQIYSVSTSEWSEWKRLGQIWLIGGTCGLAVRNSLIRDREGRRGGRGGGLFLWKCGPPYSNSPSAAASQMDLLIEFSYRPEGGSSFQVRWGNWSESNSSSFYSLGGERSVLFCFFPLPPLSAQLKSFN